MIRHLLTTLLLASLALAEQKETVKRAIDSSAIRTFSMTTGDAVILTSVNNTWQSLKLDILTD